jgi:hypothetical protein
MAVSAPRLRRIYHPQVPLTYDYLGPTSLGNEDEPSGLLNKKKNGKENKGSNKNVRSGLRADGLGNTDADL